MIKILSLCLLIASTGFSWASENPLPSWNEGKAKQAIVNFVQKVTDQNSSQYIPSKDRVATFDQDGTLWVEYPYYTQACFALDQLKTLSINHPEWQKQEPYKSALEGHLDRLTLQDIEKIIAATHSGMSTEDFNKQVKNWLKTAKHPRFNRPYTELTYLPMQELIRYLQQHDFKVYIVSGGGQDFIRAYSEEIYNIPSEKVIGSSGKTKYTYQNNQSSLIKLPEVLFIDDKSGKPEAINLFIGKRPLAAFGNSDGDKEMLEWSQIPTTATLQLLIHHDDADREYAYDKDSKIGKFSDSLKEAAINNHWLIISMKNDWKKIFSEK